MLESIEITNLQNHKHTKLDLSPGVNVIIGQSRRGKSVVLRAMRKLVENRPVLGLESWVHNHNPKNRITIKVVTTDGHSVSWDGPGDQRYVVDGEPLKGFGQAVPGPVAEALNLGDINFAHQFDLPFLIFDSPGQVARYLNQVVNLDVIDRTLANALADKRRCGQAIESERATVGGLEQARDQFHDLEAAEEFIADLEVKEARLGDMRLGLAKAQIIRDDLVTARSNLEAARLPDGIEARVEALDERREELGQKVYTRDYCVSVRQSLAALRAQSEARAPLLAAEARVVGLHDTSQLLATRRRELALAVKMFGQLKDRRACLEQKKAHAAGLERQFHEEWPDRCPLCGK
jgi:exonuclease SbcC